jgi:hypothetical protein
MSEAAGASKHPASAIDFTHFDVLSFDCYGTLVDWEITGPGASPKADVRPDLEGASLADLAGAVHARPR